MNTEFKDYVTKKEYIKARPYIKGEDMTNIYLNPDQDSLEDGGMVIKYLNYTELHFINMIHFNMIYEPKIVMQET